jgi:hypothetical protein
LIIIAFVPLTDFKFCKISLFQISFVPHYLFVPYTSSCIAVF